MRFLVIALAFFMTSDIALAFRADYCQECTRDSRGKIMRSAKSIHEFKIESGYPKGRPGYHIDHIIPLACGGSDIPENMQWLLIEEKRIKDRTERKACPLILAAEPVQKGSRQSLRPVGMPVTLAVWKTLTIKERVLYISGLIDMSDAHITEMEERATLVGFILGELENLTNSHKDHKELVWPNARAIIEGWKAGKLEEPQ